MIQNGRAFSAKHVNGLGRFQTTLDLVLVGVLAVSAAAAGECAEYASSNVPVALMGDGGSYVRHTSTLTSVDSRTIADLNVKVTISYPYVNEIRLILRAPGGTEIQLDTLGFATGVAYTNRAVHRVLPAGGKPVDTQRRQRERDVDVVRRRVVLRLGRGGVAEQLEHPARLRVRRRRRRRGRRRG